MSRGTGFPARGFGTAPPPSVLSVSFCKNPSCVPRAAQRVTLRPAIRGRPDMGWKAHATWHGLSSPWVWDGASVRPSVLRPPFSPFPPVKILPCVPRANPLPSALRRPPFFPRGASTKDRRVCPLFQSLSFSAFLFFTYRNSGVTKPASKKWRSVVNTVCRRISLIITMLEQSTNE